VVTGEAAQIVTVGFDAEDLERETGTVGGWQEQRIDLDRWICLQRSHGGARERKGKKILIKIN